ncbi:hypothetical protein H0H87_004955 [Tephrocybe sp. NHM501043]|nr:hypothetical protein H0H87_004955 [Tephrocybe sp. NHM501043]
MPPTAISDARSSRTADPPLPLKPLLLKPLPFLWSGRPNFDIGMLASQGVRTTIRHVHNFIPSKTGVGTTARGLHISPSVHAHPRIPNLGQTYKLFSKSRHIITQFFNLLTAPGIRVPTPATVGRELNGAARSPTIQQGFSIHVKNSLNRSLHSTFLPRAPRPVPRGIAQVGLGTARNFSSARPLFQNLVENVPVAGRAIYNADLDFKSLQEKERVRKTRKTWPKKLGGKEMLKPRARDFSTKENQTINAAKREMELDKYFAAPVVPDVTTCLLIPLAPTPTARVPLPENPGSFLPLPALASIHNTHEMHSLRVSSLFSRLDAFNVWACGVQCSAFSHGGGSEGVCTMLKVEFVGWTKDGVRAVIGESGTGWCVLEEVKTSEANGLGALTDSDFDSDSDSTLDTSSDLSEMFEENWSGVSSRAESVTVDPSQSLFLPTLDFSSAFMEASSPAPQRSQNMRSFMDVDANLDPCLETEALSDGGRSSSWIDPSSVNGWNGFSSQFAERVVDAKA